MTDPLHPAFVTMSGVFSLERKGPFLTETQIIKSPLFASAERG